MAYCFGVMFFFIRLQHSRSYLCLQTSFLYWHIVHLISTPISNRILVLKYNKPALKFRKYTMFPYLVPSSWHWNAETGEISGISHDQDRQSLFVNGSDDDITLKVSTNNYKYNSDVWSPVNICLLWCRHMRIKGVVIAGITFHLKTRGTLRPHFFLCMI